MSFAARQIEAHAKAAWGKEVSSPVVAFHLKEPPRHNGPLTFTLGERDVTANVVWAPSELAIRFALRDATLDAPTIVFTPIREPDVATDVLIRLHKRRIASADPWEAARGLFRAVSVEPALRGKRDLAESLLSIGEPRWFDAATGGVLTEALAWRALLGWLSAGVLPGPADAPPSERDARLLDASPSLTLRVAELATSVREQLAGWLEAQHGRVGRLVGNALLHSQGSGDDATSILRAFVVTEAVANATLRGAASTEALALCRDRLRDALHTELDDAAIADAATAARAWFSWANERDGEAKAANASGAPRVSARVSDITELPADAVDALRATTMWPHSRLAEAGFAGACQRLNSEALAQLAQAHERVPAQDAGAARAPGSAALVTALADVTSHAVSAQHADVVGMAEAITRLTLFEQQAGAHAADEQGRSAGALARTHVHTGAWVDELRHRLDTVLPSESLAGAAQALQKRLYARSKAQNAAFAAAVADAARDNAVPDGMLAQESVLDRIVTPLVREGHRVLLLVMDGMSVAIARRLATEISEKWDCDPWVPARGGEVAPMLTVLPSVTEFARCSLLTGRVASGGQGAETKGLRHHPGLQRAGVANATLLHKGELDALPADQLGERVRDSGTKVLACVVNAIDDQLAGSNQLAVTWSMDAVRPLRTLLDAAFDSERVVVFTSDHGHVWDTRTTTLLPGGTSARHRPADAPASEGETLLTGDRVRAVTGHDAVIVPHLENVRYSKATAAGYHGGLTLQEAIAPLFVFSRNEPAFDRWDAVRIDLAPPTWWRLDAIEDVSADAIPFARAAAAPKQTNKAGAATTDRAAAPAKQTTPRATDVAQPSLLDLAPPAPEPAKDEPLAIMPTPAVQALFDTPAFEDAVQRTLTRADEADKLRDLLSALAQRDGKLPIRIVAQAIGLLERRVTGFVARVAPIVNRDGYQALHVNRTEQVVELDVERVCRQFGVTTP